MDLRNPVHSARVIFGGANDGQWTLPAPVIEARAALDRVHALIEALPPEPEHPSILREQLAASVAVGADLDPRPIRQAQQALDDHQERAAVVSRAREIATERLSQVLNAQARVIVEHLQAVRGLWAPTAEQAQRFLESPMGQRLQQARTNRANLNAYRALGEGARPTARVAEEGAASQEPTRADNLAKRVFGTLPGGVEINGGPVEKG